MRNVLRFFVPFFVFASVASAQVVTIRPTDGEARIVAIEVMNDHIIRVRATSKDAFPEKPASLMIVPQAAPAKGSYAVTDAGDSVVVKTKGIKAVVSKQTGRVTFFDGSGRLLVQESQQGKRFWDFTVPERETGIKGGKQLTEEMKHGLTWQLTFDSPEDEAFYGLGQHQSEELNMKGHNEDLFQYNTKVSIPFVLSNKGYGLLWDSYSYCRFGNPADYLQLNQAFRLYDKNGREGHLTGTYVDKRGKCLVRDEDSIYYEYVLPEKAAIAHETDKGGIENLPNDISLDGAKVVYEGWLEPRTTPKTLPVGKGSDYQFILYYSGYVKVYVGGRELVAERWRAAWNPNAYKFTVHVPQGEKTQLRIEWQPDGSEAYCGLRVAPPLPVGENHPLSIWSEMAKDMDYYFIAGENFDQIISGYRTLTGRASLYPKWVLGYWMCKERYKTSKELVEAFAEFRRRRLPIDNIVQDWNYWPEDQWGSHRFDASRYPNPQAMIDSIHQMHGRFMISVWPKFYCNTSNYKELDAQGWIYRQSSHDDIRDWVGPGYKNGFYDAYDADARKMFWRQLDENLYRPIPDPSRGGRGIDSPKGKGNHSPHLQGGARGGSLIDAWWMDASEPNVRDCTPMWYRKALCGPTALGTSTEYFNAYSLVNAQAIYEGQRASAGRGFAPRVFLLTRSGFAGLQRYSTATWSGDIATRWEDMRAQMTAGMNYSMSGIPFWGMDQGGFSVERRYVKAQQLWQKQKIECEDLKEWRELQTRWHQFGCFTPIFRTHGQWPDREIWNIAPDDHPCYQSFAYYNRLRYRLMPYIYSLAGWAHYRDYTLMRALVMDFLGDKEVEDIKDQWMFGPSLMACPVGYYKARNRSVYFPKQCGWYDLYTGKLIMENGESTATANSIPDVLSPTRRLSPFAIHSSPSSRRLVVDAPYDRIPVFVPEGAIIAFGPAMEWSDEKPAELITLYVYAGRDGQFQLYEDEGTNYNYERGHYATIDIRYDDTARTVTFGRRQGNFKGMLKERCFNIMLVTKDNPRPLNLDQSTTGSLQDEKPEGVMVKYEGKELRVNIE